MREPKRDEIYARDDVRKETDAMVGGEPASNRNVGDDRGGFHDTAPNPHDDAGTGQTAARAGGAITGMFFPVVILAVVAIALILYFVLG